MRKYILVFLLFSIHGFAQNLNEYKYALVPAKFSFLKEPNMYNLNALTKMYMEKYGFETFADNETYSLDFANNNSNKIYVEVIEKSNFLKTKLYIVLKDYQNKILFTSDEGTSNEKQFKVAYNLALRMAFDNFSVLKSHKYQLSQKSLGINTEPAFHDVHNNQGKPLVLYANKVIEGFDLVTSNPEVVYMNLKLTSLKDIYIAKRKEITGIFFKDNEKWFFEYYLNNQKFTELLIVEF